MSNTIIEMWIKYFCGWGPVRAHTPYTLKSATGVNTMQINEMLKPLCVPNTKYLLYFV